MYSIHGRIVTIQTNWNELNWHRTNTYGIAASECRAKNTHAHTHIYKCWTPPANEKKNKNNNAIYVLSSIKQMAHEKNNLFSIPYFASLFLDSVARLLSLSHSVPLSLGQNTAIYTSSMPVFNWQIHFHIRLTGCIIQPLDICFFQIM